MNIKKEILFRVRIAFIIIVIVSIAIIYSIIDLQFNQGEYWESKSKDINLSYLKIKASRGNILSDDGSILATSLPFYKVAFDPSIPSEELFINKVDSLSYLLSIFFKDKSKDSYKNILENSRKNGNRYLLVNRRKVDYQEKKIISQWPIFRDGRLKGGIIFEKIDE